MIIELFVLEFQLKRLEISLEEEFSHTKKSESWISCAKSIKLFRLGSEGKYLYVRELKFPTRTTWTEFNDFFAARFFCRGKVSFTPKSEYLHGKFFTSMISFVHVLGLVVNSYFSFTRNSYLNMFCCGRLRTQITCQAEDILWLKL